MELAGFTIIAVALVAAAALLARRGAGPQTDPALIQAVQGLTQGLVRLQADVTRLARSQDDLRQDVHHGREASILQLSDVAQGPVSYTHLTLPTIYSV